MSYKMLLSEKERCLVISYEGKMNTENFKETTMKIGKVLRSKGWDRMILDTRKLTTKLSIIETYTTTIAFSDSLPKGTKVAALTSSLNSEDAIFIGKVASNHGIFLKMFTELANAIVWISCQTTEV